MPDVIVGNVSGFFAKFGTEFNFTAGETIYHENEKDSIESDSIGDMRSGMCDGHGCCAARIVAGR